MTERVPRLPDPESRDTGARRGERQAQRVGHAAIRQSGATERLRAGTASNSREGEASAREHVHDRITSRIIKP